MRRRRLTRNEYLDLVVKDIEAAYCNKLIGRSRGDLSVTRITVSLTQSQWESFSFKEWYKLQIRLMFEYPTIDSIDLVLPNPIKVINITGTISFDQ